MEEELLRQILQELQSQSGTSWLDVLQFMIPALTGLLGGLLAAGVGFYAVKRSSESQMETVRLTTEADVAKISIERRLEWRREGYMDLQKALAEFIAALDSLLVAKGNHAGSVFQGDEPNEKLYLTIYDTCRERFENVRSSGRLSECGFKVADQEIGNQVRALTADAMKQIVGMVGYRVRAIEDFRKSGKVPGSATSYWPEEHATQQADIAKRTHQISELIEQRVSLAN
ncbi:MAG: hypothetical protein IH865_06895 [Chloroflexi bacterium]|nr:hypothetical protein [Chloroflexota bacterium]